MKMAIRLGVTLAAVGTLSGLGLSLTYQVTGAKIAGIEADKEKEAVFAVVAGSTAYQSQKTKDGDYFYKCFKDGKLLGYALPAQAGGYGGEIKMMVGVDPAGDIIAIKILSQQETPGLGAKIVEVRPGEKEPWFTRQFKNRKAADLNFDNIQAVTGATISSRAVLEAVKKTVEKFEKLLKE